MDAEDKADLNALVVGFLTQSLKENPNGFDLRSFERLFPERTEEPHDWFKRYKMPSALAALKQLGESVQVVDRHGSVNVSLNTRSNTIDKHLVSLVVNQKSSGKRRSHSQRVQDSFAINCRFAGFGRPLGTSNSNYNRKSRLNLDNSYQKSQNYHHNDRGPIHGSRPTIYKDQISNFVPGDPRARQAASQVRPTPPSQSSIGSAPPPTKHSPIAYNRRPSVAQSTQQSSTNLWGAPAQPHPLPKPQPPSAPRVSSSPAGASSNQSRTPSQSQINASSTPNQPRVDAAIEELRARVKERLLFLFSSRRPEIKMLFLPQLYYEEFEEVLDPRPLGYKSLTELYRSLSDFIKISYKTANPVLSAVIGESRGKENIAAKDGNIRRSSTSDSGNATSAHNTSWSSCDHNDDKENEMSEGRARYNAIDPFNVTTMLQSLEPLRPLAQPKLGNARLEDIIKYRTLRILYKDPRHRLKLDDWERRYQQEWGCHNRVKINDYGFKSMLEFFKHISRELYPIKIVLQNDEWIASLDIDSLSNWLDENTRRGNYRSVIAIDAKYEHVAFIGDKFSYIDFESLQKQTYYSDIKNSVKSAYKMCLQGTVERNEDVITFEASSTSYDDYKKKGFFTVPPEFYKSGLPCVVYDASELRWCRAIVTSAPGVITRSSSIKAFMVDHASEGSFTPDKFLCILKNHMKQPVSKI